MTFSSLVAKYIKSQESLVFFKNVCYVLYDKASQILKIMANTLTLTYGHVCFFFPIKKLPNSLSGMSHFSGLFHITNLKFDNLIKTIGLVKVKNGKFTQ